MTTKLTKKEMFATIKAQLIADELDTWVLKVPGTEKEVAGDELIDFLNAEIEKLEKKKSSSKPTKTQLENENIKEVILQVLTEVGSPMTVTELTKDSRLSMYSNQKVSSLLTQLKKAEKVLNTHEKKVSYFEIA